MFGVGVGGAYSIGDVYMSTQERGAGHDGFGVLAMRVYHKPIVPKSQICSRLAPPLLGAHKTIYEEFTRLARDQERLA